MNLNKLFEIQAVLDNRIVEEHNLQGVDLLDKKILALQVELGELANEQRSWKFWSADQEPRTYVGNPNDICEVCNGNPVFYEGDKIVSFCDHCDGCGVHFHNPLLEEYVDCLHFILSIGLELKFIKDKTVSVVIDSDYTKETITGTFNEMFYGVSELKKELQESSMFTQVETYVALFNLFIGLGELLGFTWNQIEQAYYDKNQINHERQENGY